MKKSILIIDDVQEQATSLKRYLQNNLSLDYYLQVAHDEVDIIDKVENSYYSLVILDLRMDSYDIDGIEIAKKIIESNAFTKILITSAFTQEFYVSLKDLLLTGKIIDTIDKTEFSVFAERVKSNIETYHEDLFESYDSIQTALLESYAECKNTEDNYQKGAKFENFVSLLFNNMGFNRISKRKIDKSQNEVDLIIRNDIEDNFLEKFGKYFLVECKNIPTKRVDKNMFILFKNKLENTANMSEFGIIATTGNFTRTAYLEAIRESSKHKKVIFLSNLHFEKLIKSVDKIEMFKRFIDEQVKDN